jgi:hypothetical protein
MYQTNVVQGPTALSVLIATIDYPWYLHSVVPLGGPVDPNKDINYMVISGYRKGKEENALPALDAKDYEKMWSRVPDEAS